MRLLTFLIFASLTAPMAAAAAPKPQYSAEELEKSFARPPAQAEETSATKGFTLFTTPAPPPAHAGPPTNGGKKSAHGTVRHASSGGAVAAPTSSGKDLLITFANNSSALTPQAMANAREFAKALNSPGLSSVRFAIDGHTNAVGDHDSNLKLSQDRARALVDFLVRQGVDRSRLDATGYGFDHPLDGEHPAAAVNRRVEARRLS